MTISWYFDELIPEERAEELIRLTRALKWRSAWRFRLQVRRVPRTALGSGVVPMPAGAIVPRYGIQVLIPARPTLSIDGDTFEVEEVSLGGTWRIVTGLPKQNDGSIP